MAQYIGQAPINGYHAKQTLTGDGSTTAFTLDQTVASETALIVSVGGVIQEPKVAYNLTIGGTKISFTEAPSSTDTVYVQFLGTAVVANLNDINGTEFFLDVDGDTSFTADTDDEIDIRVGGTDRSTIKATGFHNLDSIKFVAGTGDDMQMYHDGTNSYLTNSTGALKLATETSGIAVTIGHSTSEVTIADNATVTGNLTVTGTLTQTGTQTFDGGIDVDNFNINGTTIALSSGDMTLDSAGDIILDADGGDVFFKDAGTTFGSATNTSGNLIIKSGTTTAATFSGANVTLAGTVDSGAITSTGAISGASLTADDVAIDGKVITMTGSSSDTAVFTAGANGTLSIVTTDAAAAAANIQITADGTAELAGTTVTLDSSGGITLDADGGTITFADAGSSLGTITSSGYSGTAAVATTVTITDNENTDENNAIVFTAGGDVDGGNIGLESDGDLTYNPSSGTLNVPNISVTGTQTIVNSVTMNASNAVIFEGATADAHETTLTTIDATGDRTISLPNVSGTLPVLAAASATAITSTPEELNLLDGVSGLVQADLTKLAAVDSTATELNIIDGNATVGTTAVADGDGIVTNDGGTMRQTTVQTFATYFGSEITAMSNLVTTGALDSGSITSGFGAIDNGASNITNGGLVHLDVDADADDLTGDSATGRLTIGAGQDLNLYHGGTNSYIVNDTGDLIIDTAGDIILDADGADIKLKDAGTQWGVLYNSNGHLIISSEGVSDKDIYLRGNDGGSVINAMQLDMSAAGAATFNNDVTAFSDIRLKDNIETIPNALEKVCAMRGVNFTRNDNNDQPGTGVIAQEMQEVFPVVVKENNDENNTLSVSYGNLVGVLIESIKELKAEIDELKGN
jgi:hypothetical protein